MRDSSSPQNEEENLQRARELGHEPRDAPLIGVVLFGIGLLALIGVTLLLMYGLIGMWGDPRQRELDVEARRPPVVFDEELRANLQRVRKQQEALRRQTLNSYDWVDRQQAVARIPVNRAIKLLAERGKLAFPQEPAEQQPEEQEPEEQQLEEQQPIGSEQSGEFDGGKSHP